jgi:pimeloyl-ACP methyl ester carboxylesterase
MIESPTLSIASMNFEKKQILAEDDTPLTYYVRGNPLGPAILICNGWGARHTYFLPIITHFESQFRFIAWDYRGQYNSGRPQGQEPNLSILRHAEDGILILEKEHVEHCHGLAWSMGCQVLLEMSKKAPFHFESLALHNGYSGKTITKGIPSLMPLQVVIKSLKAIATQGSLLKEIVKSASKQNWVIEALTQIGLFHPKLERTQMKNMFYDLSRLDLALSIDQLLELQRHQACQVLHQITCPVLLLYGNKDMLVPFSEAERMAEKIKTAHTVCIEGGSHYSLWEFPHLFQKALTDFWDKVLNV